MGSVDTSLHPYATGAAASLVAAHSEPSPLKFWAGWFCPFVQRAWIVLEEKNIAYQYHEVNPYKKESDFLALNPRGLVPTLEVPTGKNSSKPLIESTVICEYLDEVYSNSSKHGKLLLPEDAYERARCRIWIDFVGSRIVPAFYRWIQHRGEGIEEKRGAFWGHVATFVKEMIKSEGKGPWFLGERFSMVDVSIAPWVMRLFLMEHYKEGGLGVPTGQDGDEEVWQRWKVFVEAVEKRESVLGTWSERRSYVDAYKRYADNETMSQVGQATRKGEKLP